ncbi:hypothetical protein BAY61_10150 [Prauserella marina]|uniref:Uncharacterized protein n=2 Tax=Prauserella marina TaxID=530584 RepID=A0A222VN24_9PSEU|nr:hypothetical protein BAY61_10150 [Prauserella marina]PWV84925.1 hypothetical protein DES30_101944 [Prauserella marina]SDC09274.1 hypothetical protein SAMN05421630_101393 [Prauserella marina]
MSGSMTRLLAAGAVGVLGVALTATTAATAVADEYESHTVQADVDGDGSLDDVTLTEVSPTSQTLTFALAGGPVEVTIEGDASYPLQQPRPVDVNSDGTHEIMVAEYVGANTVTFNAWYYDPARGKIFPVANPDGSRLQVYEGGGAAARSGYNCFDYPDTGDRDLEALNARLVDSSGEVPLFDGTRIRYHVEDGVAREVQRFEYEAIPGDDPRLDTDPRSCGAIV